MTDPSTGSGRLLTIQQAADYLGVSRSAMYRLLEPRGGIPWVRLTPHARRIRQSDIDDYLAKQIPQGDER